MEQVRASGIDCRERIQVYTERWHCHLRSWLLSLLFELQALHNDHKSQGKIRRFPLYKLLLWPAFCQLPPSTSTLFI